MTIFYTLITVSEFHAFSSPSMLACVPQMLLLQPCETITLHVVPADRSHTRHVESRLRKEMFVPGTHSQKP